MRVVELSDVCQVSKRKVAPEDIQHGTPYVGLEHINPDGFYLTELVEEGELKSTKNVFKPGQILFGKLRPYLRKTALAVSPGICSTDVIVLDPKDVVSPQYLTYFLRQDSTVQLATERCSGANLPRISPKELMRFDFPLPPLEEQKRIAGILDEADGVRKKTQALIDKYDELAQSLFLDMFGDPVTNPKGWEVRKGADLFDLNSGKYLPTRELSDSFEYPCFGGNGVTGYANDYLLSEETLVIGRVGAYCGNVHLTPPKSWVTDNAIYIKSMSDAFRLKWLEFVFKSMNFHRFADFSGQPKITQKPIYDLLYPVPPIKKQMEFEDQLNELSKVKSNQHSVLCNENNLVEALLQKAFKGELT